MTQEEAHDVVVAILARRSGTDSREIAPTTNLLDDLGLDGDDGIDAILDIAQTCNTDINSFDGQKYFNAEPSLASLFQRKQQKTPLTVAEIVAGVRSGRLG